MAEPRLASSWGAAVVLACALWGCSPYSEVNNASDLDSSSRAVVVEVVTEGGAISDWVQGTYLGSNLVVDDEIPMADGHPDFNANSGHEVGSSAFGAHGGIVSFGAAREPLYVLGARASSTSFLFSTQTFLAFVVAVPRAKSRCEYVGTIHYGGPGRVAVRDEFQAHHAALAAAIAGCQLTPNVGSTLLKP